MRNAIMLMATIMVALGAAPAASGPAQAAASTEVKIPLDQTDKRFGKFYVSSLSSLLYRPEATDPVPTVVFMHGCGGIGGLSMVSAKSYAEHFASQGYATLILDISDDRSLGETPCNDRSISFALLTARRGDLDAAVKWLVANKIAIPGKIVSLGSSHGGQTVIEHDQKGGGLEKLAGEISFYPGCDRGKPYARYPLLILVGDKDMTDGPRRSLALNCADYAKAANRAGGAHVEAVSYPGAVHGFDVEGMSPGVSQSLNPAASGYQPAAANASLQKIDDFLAKVLR